MSSDGDSTIHTLRPTGDDLVLPFMVERTGVRGRLVRTGPAIDTILSRHDYPEPVSIVLGEALVIAALLGTSLKVDGTLTLQTHSDGPVSLLVASYRSPGVLRGYAMVDHDRLAEREEPSAPGAVLGEGTLALTIDPGGGLNRYQGLVPLNSNGLDLAIQDYFAQSEQIATRVMLAVGRRYVPGQRADGPVWRAGGLFVQHLAADGGMTDAEERAARRAAEGTAVTEAGEPVEEAWNRVTTLMATTEDHELLDPLLAPERLLMRLFHEDGVRVFDKSALGIDCRCTPERLRDILARYAGEDLDDLVENGVVTMHCEFCNRDYTFDPAEISARAAQAGGAADQENGQ